MAIETLYATSHIAGTFTNPTNAVGNTPTTWAGQLNTSASETSRWAMGNPVNQLTTAQIHTISVLVKKGSNSGTPTIQVNLYINGVLVTSVIPTTNVTNSTAGGQTINGSFTTANVSSKDDIEFEVIASAAGGSPSVRNSVQLARITMAVDTTAQAAASIGGFGSTSIVTSGTGAVTTPSTDISGVGSTSLASSGTGSFDTPDAPSAVSDLSGIPGGNGEVDLSWTEPV